MGKESEHAIDFRPVRTDRTDPRILERYMGRDAAGSFLDHHRRTSVYNCAQIAKMAASL